MAKIFVIDEKEQTRVPFLRGILTRSLQDDCGLPFDDAYRLASRIRDELEGRQEITTDALHERVVRLLETEYGPAMAERCRAARAASAALGVLVAGREVIPFSVAHHQRCLEGAGLSPEDARSISNALYLKLLDQGVSNIASDELARITYDHLRHDEDLGPEVAQRYLVWLQFRRSGRPLILLIGGASGCGKSTIASELATRLNIVRTQSTDMLREVMRMLLPPRLLPVLHTSSFEAWKHLRRHGPAFSDDPDTRLADGYQAQAELLAVPSEAVVQRSLRERVSLILEGVHVHPGLVERLPRDHDAIVQPVMIAVLKPQQLRRRFVGRAGAAPGRRARRYLEHFDAIWRLQSHLLSEADRAGVPIIANEDKAQAVQDIMVALLDNMSRQFTAEPEQVFG